MQPLVKFLFRQFDHIRDVRRKFPARKCLADEINPRDLRSHISRQRIFAGNGDFSLGKQLHWVKPVQNARGKSIVVLREDLQGTTGSMNPNFQM